MPIKFKRSITKNHGSLQVTIPKPICEELDLEKGDQIEFIYNNGSFTCKKVN